MNVLILSCVTGGGHNAAGAAVKKQLQKQGHQVVMINPYQLKSNRLAGVIDKVYIGLVQKNSTLFGFVYRLGELYRRLPFPSPVYYINRKMAYILQEYLLRHPADVIITPHLYPAEIITNMKKMGMEVPLSIFVATDYACIPFTEETDCDYVVIPSEKLIPEFRKYGIPKEKSYPLGIPTADTGVERISPEEAKRQLGLDPAKEYLLIAGGSMGAGALEEVVEMLYRARSLHKCKLIMVCGNNQQLYSRLQKRYADKIELVGYTDKMPLYLKAGSIFITKPGGLSSTEAAAARIPLIHICPIPGCETKNMQFFKKAGMALAVTNPKEELTAAVLSLQKQENRNKMIQCQKKYVPGTAAAQLGQLVEEGIE